MQKLKVSSSRRKGTRKEVAGIWDPGSTLSFITFTLANDLDLHGEPVELEICTVGGVETKLKSEKFQLILFDKGGREIQVEVLGIDRISTDIESVNIDGVRGLFQKSGAAEVDRPDSGPVDLLIGFSYAAYHPVKVESNGHLLLMENMFGHLIAGSHPEMSEGTRRLVKHAVVLRIEANIERFHSIESLGVSCIPSCGGCKCGKCHAGGKSMTLEEEKEYKMIREKLKFDEVSGRWMAPYPWIKDSSCLPWNRPFAYATLQSTEKRLTKNKLYADTYKRQMEDILERKAARIVNEEELRGYPGTMFYIAHHDVLSPSSLSTPMRVVFNSSARVKGGISLNDCLAKGPCLLNQLLGILLRFRRDRFAFIGDIRKMFHSIDIPIEDQMTHLYLWRNLDTTVKPNTYAMTVVNMGDRPASAIAQTALRMTAEQAKEDYPAASDLLIRNSYMDDIPGSAETERDGMQLMREAEHILKEKGFTMKNWTFSGQMQGQEKSLDQAAVQELLKAKGNAIGKVLGMGWEPEGDTIQFPLASMDGDAETTKRKCLSLICSIYDPVGLLAPVTVTAKIVLRNIWANKPQIDWDHSLPVELQEEWNKFRESLMYVRGLKFHRSIRPENGTAPILVMFSDGSKNAYGTAAYVRWHTPDGFVSRLLAAKSRIAPLKIVNIVRLELCGALLTSRLYSFIMQELDDLQFERVYHVVDSEIAKAMIAKDSYGFSTFAANRIGEIHERTDKDNWYWVEGSLNVADLATRPVDVETLDMDMNSEWQSGPSFLRLPETQWPIRRETNVQRLPEQRKNFVGSVANVCSSSIADKIDINRFSKLSRLLYTTARVQKLIRRFQRGGEEYEFREITPTDLDHAEETWVKYVQEGISANLDKYKRLLPTIENGIVVVGGRAEKWLYATWNREKFVLLPAKHRFSQLIAERGHQQSGHLGVDSTVAMIRSRYWIVGIRRIVRSIISRCKSCKVKFKRLASQKMSPLPIERIKPSPAFQNVGLDYFGPFQVKGEVQRRVRRKCWGVIFTCDSSRAVHVDIAQDCTTDAFLQVVRRFASIRGWPKKIHSDNAPTLVGADNELKRIVAGLDWKLLETYGHKFGMVWSFCPADAPWQNGSTEALVKSVKRALKVVIGEQICSYAEFQTVVYEAAQLVNQRPIGKVPSSPDDGTYLCPNDLLLGRSTNHVPQGPFDNRAKMKHRIDFIEEIVGNFWKRWSREVFPNLVIEPKWHVERRNLQVGDVVMIQDSNAFRSDWKLGVVEKVLDSKDGRVRNVDVKYKNDQTDVVVKRAVQKLIVVVPVDGTGEEQC